MGLAELDHARQAVREEPIVGLDELGVFARGEMCRSAVLWLAFKVRKFRLV
jgi:hypothetical protein